MDKAGSLLCMGCMSKLERMGVCPVCGYSNAGGHDVDYQSPGSVLGARYLVGALKHKNGEGALYIGYDNDTAQRVWIREYFPYTISRRDAGSGAIIPNTGCGAQYKALMSDFVDTCNEVKRLGVSDPVIPIKNVIGENNTVYAIYKAMDVITFEDFLLANGGKLTPGDALELLLPLFNAVGNMHSRGGIHRGLSPYTIYIDKEEKIYLGDFALSATRTGGSELKAELFNGFSAPEQYASNAWQGTWTDVYALAAIFYRTVSGVVPPKSTLISPQRVLPSLADLVMDVSPKVSEAVRQAMQIDPQQRTQTVQSLVSGLIGNGASSTAVYDVNTLSPLPVEYAPQTAVKAYEGRGGRRYGRHVNSGRRRVREENGGGVSFRYIVLALIFTVALFGGGLMMFMNAYFPDLVRRGESPGTGGSQSRPREETSSLDTRDDDRKTVPEFVGRTIFEIRANSEYNERFDLEVIEQYSDSYPSGTVCEQSPLEGTLMPNRGTVILYVSKGRYMVKMPDLVGLTSDDAIQAIKEMAEDEDSDLPFEVLEIFSEDTKPGTVARTSPAAEVEFNPSFEKIVVYVAKEIPTSVPSQNSQSQTASSKPAAQSSSSTASSSKPYSRVEGGPDVPYYGSR